LKISPKQLLLKTLCPLLLLLLQTTALAQSGPARMQLERFSQDLESLQASFDQKVISTEGAVEDESTGQVWLSRPRRFRWEYTGDFPEQVVADGERVWLYDETLEQVTVRDQSGFSADTPLTLLTDISRLDEQFEVRELGDGSGMHLLELRSRSQEAEFERVLLGLQDDTLLLMAMEDAFGFRTEIRFRDIQRNPSLDMSLFQFTPPPGTDVIGDWPAGPDLEPE
jgi:outer membrane lipoprotein carrier protein